MVSAPSRTITRYIKICLHLNRYGKNPAFEGPREMQEENVKSKHRRTTRNLKTHIVGHLLRKDFISPHSGRNTKREREHGPGTLVSFLESS